MGRARQQPSEPVRDTQEQPPEPGAIARIAALLLAGATASAIASALLDLLPRADVTLFPEQAAKTARTAATLVLGATGAGDDSDGAQGRTDATRAKLTPDDAILSALYAVNAAKRLFRGREDFSAALDAERRYLAYHNEARQRRRKARAVQDAMVDLYGPVLTWRHGVSGLPADPRPSHEAADGLQFDTRLGTPTSTGAVPGSLPGCSCAWGPPVEGARTLV